MSVPIPKIRGFPYEYALVRGFGCWFVLRCTLIFECLFFDLVLDVLDLGPELLDGVRVDIKAGAREILW